MIPSVSVTDVNTSVFFDEYEITKEELDWLVLMAEEGRLDEALDVLVNEYQIPASLKYRDAIIRYLSLSELGVFEEEDRDKATRSVSLLTVGLTTLLLMNFRNFTERVYAPAVFKKEGLGDEGLKQTILGTALATFSQSVEAAMSQTQSFVLNGIRSLQRDMIVQNIKLSGSNMSKAFLDSEVKNFKSNLKSKYPSIYKAMEEGNILTSRKFGANGEMVRHYKLDYYADMATRTTLLNVDRLTTMTVAAVNDEPVVEYYLADSRGVKKDREICQEILGTLVLGKSLLALNDEAASVLGIMTVTEAMNTPDYAMGPYCRHSMRRCGEDLLQQIRGLLNNNA